VSKIYELASYDEYKDFMTATSHLTGDIVNRFCHIHQSIEDLVKKVKMQRLVGQKTGTCFQRCVGFDAGNTMFSVTYDVDKKHNTNYHARLKEYWTEIQQQDLMVAGSMTDPKGDRSKRPSEQSDPDQYLRVVDRSDEGVIVRGAKIHQTGFANSHRTIVMPTLALRTGEENYAISFGIDCTEKGITMVYGRQTSDLRKIHDEPRDSGNFKYGSQEVFVIFDDVFIPNEHIFLDGELDYTGELVNRFASYHRNSYGGCKPGKGDVYIGAAALAAKFNGLSDKVNHIKDKLVEMSVLNETIFSGGIASSALGFQREAGNYEVDMLTANVCKQNVTRFPYEISRLTEDLAGGIICTLPSYADFQSEEVGSMLKKYLKTSEETAVDDRYKLIRLIENLAMGTGSIAYKTESMHGAGSPQAQRIMIARQGQFNEKIQLVKDILDI
jgi:4-hydroxybutyryl-CoA dehydratase/vinylacetyl-CoA-Delta-isomerase